MASKPKSDAQAAYEAWADAHGWTSPFGTTLTAWQCLSLTEQQIWKVVAEAVNQQSSDRMNKIDKMPEKSCESWKSCPNSSSASDHETQRISGGES